MDALSRPIAEAAITLHDVPCIGGRRDGVADRPAPLAGIRVLEFGQVIAGNYAGLLLAELGADVIKVESPTGDPARNAAIAPLRGESALHLTVNRGKRSIVLDLKSPEGRDVFYRLVRGADAVVDNFRPGVMERLGLDHATLRTFNPAIVSVSVSGFGQDGPARDRPAFDLVIQALSGHMSITGDPDHAPARMGAPMADLIGGVFGCLSVLAALVGRDRDGVGRRVDVSMLDCLVAMLGYDATIFLNTGKQLERLGSAQAHMVPWQAFATSDGYVALTAREEKFWVRLCEAIDRPDLRDHPLAATNLDRVANRDWLVPQLQERLLQESTEEWLRRFTRFDLPAAAVNDFEGVFSDPQVQARELVGTFHDPELGAVRYVAHPLKFDGWSSDIGAPPRLGAQTRSILEELGMEAEEIEDLQRRGAVGPDRTAPAADPPAV